MKCSPAGCLWPQRLYQGCLCVTDRFLLWGRLPSSLNMAVGGSSSLGGCQQGSRPHWLLAGDVISCHWFLCEAFHFLVTCLPQTWALRDHRCKSAFVNLEVSSIPYCAYEKPTMRSSPLTRAGVDMMVCIPGGRSLGMGHALLPMTILSSSPGNSASSYPPSTYLHETSAFTSSPSLEIPILLQPFPPLFPEMRPELRWLSRARPRFSLHFYVVLLYGQSQFSFQGSPQK